MRRAISAGACLGGAGIGYVLLVRGALTLDLGLGRRLRPLGPMRMHIAAPRETVFDVIARPYLDRTPRAMDAKLEVLERGSDLVLAAHFTPIGAHLTATTVETVRFERRERVAFRLLRGPVPHVLETFELSALARKFANVFAQAAWAVGRSSRWVRRSRSARVNFHSNGVAICS